MVRRHESLEPSSPAELLSEIVIPGTGLSKAEIARRLGVSRQAVYDVLNGKSPITPSLAARLGKLFGNGAGLWLRMQADHDAWRAERETDLSTITSLKAA